VLLDRAGIADLPALHERLPGRPTPVVDVTGQALEACDAAFRLNDPSSWSEVAGLLNRFAARGAQLTPAARGGAEPDARLLACLYVADRPLRLVHDPSQRVPVRPGGWFTEPDAMLAAERLAARGLLTRQIRERPPGGLEFIYALTERAVAELTASDPRTERSEGTESVRATLERAVREASRTFGSVRSGAGEAGSALAGAAAQVGGDPAAPREAVAPVVALDRLPQTKRDVAAEADPPGKTLDPAGLKAVASSGPETRLAPAQAGEGARSGSSGPAPKSHGVQAFLDLIKPSAGQPVSPAGQPAPTAGQPAKTAEPRPSAGRILLVEAVDVNREVARAMLEAGGCAVDAATGGAEAVAAVQEHAYGLVLMAVQMPGVDGLAAARRIRALPPPAGDVPIVGMSASPLPDQVSALREAGMNDHLGKPFRRADLEAVIARWRRPEPEPDTSPEAFDRAVYDGLTELVGRERVAMLLDRLAAQLSERFAGEPASDADRVRLARDAHAMISAAGALGFSALSAACQSLETAVSAGGGVAAPLERVKASRARALRAIAVLKQAG
jgi:CheY-like chemotaxis protein